MSALPAPPSPPRTQRQLARSARTYYWDRLRGGFQGMLEAVWGTFALLVAIRVFQADESVKQFLPAAAGFGLVLGPFSLTYLARRGMRLSQLIAVLFLVCAALLALAASLHGQLIFVICVVLAQMTMTQGAQLSTALYATNYGPQERGHRLSGSLVILSLSGIAFAVLGGQLLDWKLEAWPWIFAAGALAALGGAWTVLRIPSPRLRAVHSGGMLDNLRLVQRDRVFAGMLVAWMLMGTGNLMMIPMRVEYLANPAYGINASNTEITLILMVVVAVFRVLSTRIWGRLFDRLNLITLRNLLNTCFALSIAVFFCSHSLWVAGIGAALLGIAFGGGGVVWTLWVTKIAPPDKVAAYMSIHGFTTGLRQSAAPFITYALLGVCAPRTVALIAIGLIVLSSLIFLPMRARFEPRRP